MEVGVEFANTREQRPGCLGWSREMTTNHFVIGTPQKSSGHTLPIGFFWYSALQRDLENTKKRNDLAASSIFQGFFFCSIENSLLMQTTILFSSFICCRHGLSSKYLHCLSLSSERFAGWLKDLILIQFRSCYTSLLCDLQSWVTEKITSM